MSERDLPAVVAVPAHSGDDDVLGAHGLSARHALALGFEPAGSGVR